jgi:hypothetical protein
MKLFQWNLARRQFLSLSSLGLTLPMLSRASSVFAAGGASQAAEQAKSGSTTMASQKGFIPNDAEAELRQKNIKTIEKWLTFAGVTRHKNRTTLYTEDFITGNPSIKDSSQPSVGRAAVEQMAAEVAEHPEKETFQGWHFYNARIYAALDNPNLFNVNCLGKGTVITTC